MNDDEYYATLYLRKFPHKDKLDEIRGIIKWDLFRPVLALAIRFSYPLFSAG